MKSLLFTTLILLFATSIFAQKSTSESENKCWYNEDWKTDKSMGVSSDKAYNELLKGKTPKPVVVAIIDGGTDITHEDLKNVIWVNVDEIPDNGIDDDKNGYIDDIHGWSFIGNPDGRSVNQDNLEQTRIYRMLKPKYEFADSLVNVNNEEYRLYAKCRDEVEAELTSAKNALKNVNSLYENLKYADSVLTIYFKTNEYTEDQLRDVKSSVMVPLAEYILHWKKEGLGIAEVEGIKEYYEGIVLYRYNINFDPRYIVGDDWTNNSNPYYGSNDVTGPSAGHGTMVAGNVAAVRGNNLGPDGVTSNAQLMIIRVVPDGDERDKDVANAILYAVNNGATIINMSFGKSYSPQKHFVDSALRIASQYDVLIIHAAGNEAENNDSIDHYPLNRDANGLVIEKKWLTIGASTSTGDENLPAPFSNYGSKTVDLFAPGQQIYSCQPNNKYGYVDGTSMACPITSGVAAIIRSYYPELTAMEVKEVIMKSVQPFNKKVIVPNQEGESTKVKFSELSVSGGIVNVYNALKLAEEMVKAKKG
jgi:subtilisin family serine protease